MLAKLSILALLAAAVIAQPVLVRRDVLVHCGQSTGGDIDLAPVYDQIAQAPSEPSNVGHSYPHEFKNYEHLPISSECDGEMMLELPIFADGHAYDLEHGENPGAVRAIYGAKNKALCAVVAHDANDSNFHQCTV
ncbi:hypothetical protein MCUN1_001687 [Malassezia cuniculi]|uniref:Uncharacterized protein n=1 Tax=Malassezia cuniculi TaxID=948313 RepID=A0AAF0J637_9BASI|nr:hypothetical protein MCUN1_001687 [Malassezia cuniculi]